MNDNMNNHLPGNGYRNERMDYDRKYDNRGYRPSRGRGGYLAFHGRGRGRGFYKGHSGERTERDFGQRERYDYPRDSREYDRRDDPVDREREYLDHGGKRDFRGPRSYQGGYKDFRDRGLTDERSYESFVDERDPRERDPRDRDPRERDPRDRDPRDRDPRERDPRDRDRGRDDRDAESSGGRSPRKDYQDQRGDERSVYTDESGENSPYRGRSESQTSRIETEGSFVQNGRNGDRGFNQNYKQRPFPRKEDAYRDRESYSPRESSFNSPHSGGSSKEFPRDLGEHYREDRKESLKETSRDTYPKDHTPKEALSDQTPKKNNPWISILRIKDPRVSATLESQHSELEALDKRISNLQADKIRLQCSLSVLEIYAERDDLSGGILEQKLDEFTYL